MMRSMFSGVSGLKTHQTRMDVIGNNIANVNTVGFKSGRVTFQEVFSQTLKGSGSPDSASARAGTNPMQVGLGVGISAIDTIMTRGSSQRTDNPTDMMIDGDGFFIVRASSADTYKFTRAGNFGVDELGNLNLNGYTVCGWEPNSSGQFDTNAQVSGINLYRSYDTGVNKMILGAKATTKAYLSGNLDSATAIGDYFTVPTTVYDSQGNDYKVSLKFTKTNVNTTTDETTWQLSPESATITGANVTLATTDVVFDKNGVIKKPAPTPVMKVASTDQGSEDIDVTLDLSSLTMYASDSSVKPTDVNGYPPGTLTTFNVGTDGIITGIYSNGQQQALGMIALAVFPNAGGMTKVGENMFIPSTNSGEYTKGIKPGSEGSGALSPGTLEMSNVDLSQEFTNMIVTQRGFQANSRIITASDEMLQELVNLKR